MQTADQERNLTVCRFFRFYPSDGKIIILSFAVMKTVFPIKNTIWSESEPHNSASQGKISVTPEIPPPMVSKKTTVFAYTFRSGKKSYKMPSGCTFLLKKLITPFPERLALSHTQLGQQAVSQASHTKFQVSPMKPFDRYGLFEE